MFKYQLNYHMFISYQLYCSDIQEPHGLTTLAVQETEGREETVYFKFNLYALGFSRSLQEKYAEKQQIALGINWLNVHMSTRKKNF